MLPRNGCSIVWDLKCGPSLTERLDPHFIQVFRQVNKGARCSELPPVFILVDFCQSFLRTESVMCESCIPILYRALQDRNAKCTCHLHRPSVTRPLSFCYPSPSQTHYLVEVVGVTPDSGLPLCAVYDVDTLIGVQPIMVGMMTLMRRKWRRHKCCVTK